MIRPVASRQRGTALMIGLVMLTVLTVMVLSAVKMSTVNLQVVGNVQVRDEAIAAANRGIEVAFAAPIGSLAFPVSIPVDIDNDGAPDYTVSVERTCLSSSASTTTAPVGTGTSVQLGFTAPLNDYLVLWDYDATATDNSGTGALVRVRHGIRQLLTQAECDSWCPPAEEGVPCS
jgi:hypothetical protein